MFFLGVKPSSLGFTTCSLVTILAVLSAPIISNFVVRTVEEALNGTACISVLSSTLDFEILSEGRITAVTNLE